MLEQYNDLLSILDMQEVLCIGRNRAYELLNNGTIPSLRIGKSWKIPKEAVIQYLRSWQHNPAIKGNRKGSGAR